VVVSARGDRVGVSSESLDNLLRVRGDAGQVRAPHGVRVAPPHIVRIPTPDSRPRPPVLPSGHVPADQPQPRAFCTRPRRAQDRASARAARKANRVVTGANPSPRPAKASSLAALARTAWFGDWKGHVPPAIVAESRTLVRASIEKLRSRDRSAAKDIAEIARCTRAFNTLDVRHDHFITTIEAEAIHEVLCELAAACGIADDVAASIAWRPRSR